jgi:hypothetical protein
MISGIAKMSRLLVAVLSVVVLLAVICAVWYWNNVVPMVKHADLCFGAMMDASNAVNQYVREKGKWPTSWTDLESTPSTGIGFLPPGRADEIRQFVKIDFNLTLSRVADQEFDEFRGIVPIGAVWGGYEGSIESLLKTVRKVRDRQRDGKWPERRELDEKRNARRSAER